MRSTVHAPAAASDLRPLPMRAIRTLVLARSTTRKLMLNYHGSVTPNGEAKRRAGTMPA
jgi:hypothetical protein